MMGTVDELVEWLRAQLDEDERIARAAGGGHWPDSPYEMRDSGLAHARCHDPARVLREVEAKRRIIDYYVEMNAATPSGWDDSTAHTAAAVESVIHLLALPYSDRPGYREEWRP